MTQVSESARTKPLIWALDIATVTGWAIGRVGEKPKAKSVRFAPPGSTSDELFLGCMQWFSEAIEKGPLPDILAVEELLPPTARRGTTNTQTQHRLAGMHGIIRALAKGAGIPETVSATVPDIRQHFIGERTLTRDKAKPRVMAMCRMLGWPATDTDTCDAEALFSYVSALLDPKTALQVTPLFGHRTWEDVARERASKR